MAGLPSENFGFYVQGLFVSYSSWRKNDGTISYRAFVATGNNVVRVTSKEDIFSNFNMGDTICLPIRVSVYENVAYFSADLG